MGTGNGAPRRYRRFHLWRTRKYTFNGALLSPEKSFENSNLPVAAMNAPTLPRSLRTDPLEQ